MAIPRVLFVCTQNGARSKIAEEYARQAAGSRIEVRSASYEAGKIGPVPIAVMAEVGIELQVESPRTIFDQFRDGVPYDYVVTLCNPSGAEGTPNFLSTVDDLYRDTAKRLDWTVGYFKSLQGTEEERMEKARRIRDDIRAKTLDFLIQIGITPAGA